MDITGPDFQIDAVLALPENDVQLWSVHLETIQADEGRWRDILSFDERIRADRFHFSRDRQLFTASRAILRMLLAGYLAAEPRAIDFSYSKKEKPSLGAKHEETDITFNL